MKSMAGEKSDDKIINKQINNNKNTEIDKKQNIGEKINETLNKFNENMSAVKEEISNINKK